MLRILDVDFNILETIPKCKTVNWISRFTECGSFTITLPNSTYNFIKQGNFVRYGDRYGIIEYIAKDETGLTLTGYDLKAVTAYRIADKGNYSGKAETVIKSIVSDNTQGSRSFNNFSVAEATNGGNTVNYEISSLDSVENHLKKICEDSELGYDVTVANRQMVFDVQTPQTRNFVYSLRKKNISGYEYTLDALSQKNVVVCETKSDGFAFKEYKSYKISLDGGTICFKNGSCHVMDSSEYDVTSSNFPYMYAELDVSTDTVKIRCEQSGAMTDTSRTYYIPLGKIKFDSSKNFSEYVSYDLPQYVVFYWNDTEPSGFARKEKYGNCETWKDDIVKLSESATAEIANATDYKTVWNLGDFITIKIELFNEMISFTRQITEVEENISASGTTVVPTFGQPKENIIRKLIKGRL